MRIGIIGFGNMGSAIWEKISQHYSVFVFDKNENLFLNKKEIQKADSLEELLEKSDVIILAIKPQDLDDLAEKIYPYSKDKLFISIMVSISIKYLTEKLPHSKIIRVMPNLPAQIGKGLSIISEGYSDNKNEINFTKEIFSYVGKTLIVDEKLMNIITAISGSGPGFYFKLVENFDYEKRQEFLKLFISTLQELTEEFGFSKEQSEILAKETGFGAEAYLQEIKIDPTSACKKVASKGGTTEAGLAVLKDIDSLKNAIISANNRAIELSK